MSSLSGPLDIHRNSRRKHVSHQIESSEYERQKYARQLELLIQGSLKELTQLYHKRLGRTGRFPFDSFCKNLRALFARAPALDETRVNVYNPILRHTLAL